MTIAELVRLVCEVVGYQGQPRFDTSRPDGTPRKLVDVSAHQCAGMDRQDLVEGRAGAHLSLVPRECRFGKTPRVR